MLRWLLSLLGIRTEPAARQAPEPSEGREAPVPRLSEVEPPDMEPEARAFYLDLTEDKKPSDLQDLAANDRLFLAGVLKRVREKRLEVPVLPRAALELSRLLADPSSDASHFAEVLEADPALSVDILRIANSAFYGVGNPVASVRDAVVRVGLNQLRGLIVVTHLRGKVLQGGAFRREASWLSDLSLALAHLGRVLAPALELRADAAFTRGMLMHVEHFVIMGLVGEVTKDHQRKVRPSVQGMHEALVRVGPKVRELAASEWNLEEFLMDDQGQSGPSTCFVQLRRALIGEWTGEDLPRMVDGVAPERLDRALKSQSWQGSAGRPGPS